MALQELTNRRDLSYSAWHRPLSIRRYVGIETAQLLSMIDLDASIYVEYDEHSWEPLALIETAIDNGQGGKQTGVTYKLARRANLPCFTLLYKLAPYPNPANIKWQDIERFRVKQLYPQRDIAWRIYTPKEWAEFLTVLRQEQCHILDVRDNIIIDQPILF